MASRASVVFYLLMTKKNCSDTIAVMHRYELPAEEIWDSLQLLAEFRAM